MIPKGWKNGKLSDLAEIHMGTSPPSSSYNGCGEGAPLINGPTEFTDLHPIAIQWTTEPTRFCEAGDVLLCVRGSSTGRINIADQRACIGRGVAALRLLEATEEHSYLSSLLSWHVGRILTQSTGSTFPSIDKKSLCNLDILIAPIEERSRIGELLAVWSRSIKLLDKLIRAKSTRKERLMKAVLSRGQTLGIRLGCTLRRVNNPVSVDTNHLYREIGIRSHGKGVFHKGEVTGESLGNKRVYHVKPGCFTFNVVFAWEQAVARTTEKETGMIASHRFPMYEPLDDRVDIDYLLYFFKTKRGKHLLGLASPGGAGRNRTLSQDAFMKLKIPLPDIEEQRRVANLLKAADREIELLEALRDSYVKQKRGLMQQLLTGKIRVEITEGVA